MLDPEADLARIDLQREFEVVRFERSTSTNAFEPVITLHGSFEDAVWTDDDDVA